MNVYVMGSFSKRSASKIEKENWGERENRSTIGAVC